MQRDLLNCSAHCLQQWQEELRRGRRDGFTPVLQALSRDLEGAVKFALPDGGRVLDDYRGVARLFQDLRLPFPVVALEYRSTGSVAAHETPSSKRIALVWDARQAVPTLLRDHRPDLVRQGDPGLYVQSVSYMDAYESWIPVMATGYVDLTLRPVVPEPGMVSELELELVRHRLRPGYEKLPAFPIRFIAHSHYVVERLGGEHAADALFRADSGDEISAALSFAAVSSCANVRFQTVAAPPALNAKRARSGKVPFFDTRVLEVDQDAFVSRPGASAGRGGSHASPRAHLRRGHIRQVGERHLWINATTVNAWRAEPIAKSYAVRPLAPDVGAEAGEAAEVPRQRG